MRRKASRQAPRLDRLDRERDRETERQRDRETERERERERQRDRETERDRERETCSTPDLSAETSKRP